MDRGCAGDQQHNGQVHRPEEQPAKQQQTNFHAHRDHYVTRFLGTRAVARSLGVDVTTLRTWMHRTQQPSSDSETLTPSEAKELAQLRREVSVLKMERDIPQYIPACHRRPLSRCFSEP
jgi:DNA-binding transcriptional regulator YiaG